MTIVCHDHKDFNEQYAACPYCLSSYWSKLNDEKNNRISELEQSIREFLYAYHNDSGTPPTLGRPSIRNKLTQLLRVLDGGKLDCKGNI